MGVCRVASCHYCELAAPFTTERPENDDAPGLCWNGNVPVRAAHRDVRGPAEVLLPAGSVEPTEILQ